VEDPLSEAMIQGDLGAGLIEIYLDGEVLTHRSVEIEASDDVLVVH
jgi:hypothetical protein